MPVYARAGNGGIDATGYPERVKLAVGDRVVYGNHGVGRIAARKKQDVLGQAQEVVVVELDDELTVTLPIERAQSQLRPLVSSADLKRVREALRDDVELRTENWLSRRSETLEKLTLGSPVSLAEIVSEGAQRERTRRAQGARPQLSPGEQEVFGKARSLLSGEIALALDIEPTAAESWIDRHLARPA
jgi:RNA polymerase-interacting CarD/CdnL/TRCF family regulator